MPFHRSTLRRHAAHAGRAASIQKHLLSDTPYANEADALVETTYNRSTLDSAPPHLPAHAPEYDPAPGRYLARTCQALGRSRERKPRQTKSKERGGVPRPL